MRPKTRLGGHGAAGPRPAKRSIKARKRLTSACQVVGRVARNSGGLRPFPFGQGMTWIASQLSGAWRRGPEGGAVSSSPRLCRRSQLTWPTISGAVKRPQSGLRSGAKRPIRSRMASRVLGSKSEGMASLSLKAITASFKRMLGARRRGIECRSTCDPEGSHIRPGSGRVDRVVQNDVLPLKLGVEENDSCYSMELVTGAPKAYAEARASVRRQVDDKRVSTNLDPGSSRTHGVERQFQRDMVGPSVPGDDSICECDRVRNWAHQAGRRLGEWRLIGCAPRAEL